MSRIPPEGTRKYPWALGKMKIGVPVVIQGEQEGERAMKAARMWCYRNYPDGSHRIVQRFNREKGEWRIWLVKRGSKT